MTSAAILGDSQGVGQEMVLAPVLARHGLALDTNHSWTQDGAGIGAIAGHASVAAGIPYVLIFSGGGNDAGLVRANDGGAAYRQKFVDLVAQLRAAGARDVYIVTAMHSDDPSTAALHDRARSIILPGIPGAITIDGYRVSSLVPHPVGGDGTHWTRAGYAAIAAELEKALFSSGVETAVGLVGTLVFLGSAAIVAMEWLYEDASQRA